METKSAMPSFWQITTLVAVVVILILIIMLYAKSGRERFVSKKAKEVHRASEELFKIDGADVNYSRYKNKVPGADPVIYSDARKLYKGGNLTPENVQNII